MKRAARNGVDHYRLVCAWHACELMGFKSPVCESVKIMIIKINQILDYGNCEIARFRGKEAYVKSVSPRTGRFYKAGMADELAQHSKVLDSAMKVKNRVVQKQFTCFPGRSCLAASEGFNLPAQLKHLSQQCDGQDEIRSQPRAY